MSNLLILLFQSLSVVVSLLLLLGSLFAYRVHSTPDSPDRARGYSVTVNAKNSVSTSESESSYERGSMDKDDGTVSSHGTRAEL